MTKARNIANLLSTANGKIAGTNLDVSFENISDTGTEGTKVAAGTTGQRGSTTGQWRYNSTTGFFEGRNSDGTFSSLEPTPKVSSVNVTEVDSQAGGNQTIVVTGENFSSGGTISFVGSSANFNATTTTFNSITQVTAVAPKASFLNAQEPYKVRFTASSGSFGESASGLINVDTSPTWSTASGQIGGTIFEGDTVNTTVSATDPDSDAVSYAVQSGSLPTGVSINSSTGAITGTAPSVSSDTTSSFTLRATANSKSVDRAFTIIVKNDAANLTQPLGDSSCLAWYDMEGDLQDSTGSNHTTSMRAGTFASNLFDSTNAAIGTKSFNSYYNNSASVANLPGITTSYPMTMSAWVSRDNDWNTGTYGAIMEGKDSNNRRLYFGLNSSWTGDGQNVFGGHFGGGNHFTYAYPSSSYFNGKGLDNWFHVVWVIEGHNNSSSKMYLQGSALTQTNQGGTTGGSGSWSLGGNVNGGEPWRGRIDHVRVFNKALTSSEVTTLYNNESPRVVTLG